MPVRIAPAPLQGARQRVQQADEQRQAEHHVGQAQHRRRSVEQVEHLVGPEHAAQAEEQQRRVEDAALPAADRAAARLNR